MTEFEHDSRDKVEFVSKSQVKRELQVLRDLGKSLLDLPVKELEKLQLPAELHDEIIKAKSMSKGALKRQIGTIGKRIAHDDYEHIQQQLDRLRQRHHGQVRRFHQFEQWRDRLLAGDDEVMDELRCHFKNFDIQYLRQLVRNANKETAQNKPPKSARLLFQYLKQCDDNESEV